LTLRPQALRRALDSRRPPPRVWQAHAAPCLRDNKRRTHSPRRCGSGPRELLPRAPLRTTRSRGQCSRALLRRHRGTTPSCVPFENGLRPRPRRRTTRSSERYGKGAISRNVAVLSPSAPRTPRPAGPFARKSWGLARKVLPVLAKEETDSCLSLRPWRSWRGKSGIS